MPPSQDGTIAPPTAWSGLPVDLLADADFNFDPQAFFDDYLYTGTSYCLDVKRPINVRRLLLLTSANRTGTAKYFCGRRDRRGDARPLRAICICNILEK